MLVGIRGEDAGTLVCYKKEDTTREEDKARLELKVLGGYTADLLYRFSCFYGTARCVSSVRL